MHCSQCLLASSSGVARSKLSSLQNVQYDLSCLKKTQNETIKIEQSLPQALRISQINMKVLADLDQEMEKAVEAEIEFLQKVLLDRKDKLLAQIKQFLTMKRQENEVFLAKSLNMRELFAVHRERLEKEPSAAGELDLFLKYVLNHLTHGHLFKLKLEESNSYSLSFPNKMKLVNCLNDYGTFVPIDLSGTKYINLVNYNEQVPVNHQIEQKCRSCGHSFTIDSRQNKTSSFGSSEKRQGANANANATGPNSSFQPVSSPSKSNHETAFVDDSIMTLNPSKYLIVKSGEESLFEDEQSEIRRQLIFSGGGFGDLEIKKEFGGNGEKGSGKPLPLLRMIDEIEKGIFGDRMDSPQYQKETNRKKRQTDRRSDSSGFKK